MIEKVRSWWARLDPFGKAFVCVAGALGPLALYSLFKAYQLIWIEEFGK